ncbi:MAG: hypothetical protein AMXMBFR47_31510 [Planctomycetota bacterium]
MALIAPSIYGLIRRRILVNYRVDPTVMQRHLPTSMRPRLHAGFAIAGICLIRLEEIRPAGFPRLLGVSSENAAHRVAVCWRDSADEPHEGVFIPRRDTGSYLNHLAGGRLFPGEHHLADFDVEDDGMRVTMAIRSRDGRMRVELSGGEIDSLPSDSCFGSLADASAFFEGGCIGYSSRRDCCDLDGIELQTDGWRVRPLAVDRVASSYFDDRTNFPSGSIAFDHALIMRNVQHRWVAVPDGAAAKPTLHTHEVTRRIPS